MCMAPNCVGLLSSLQSCPTLLAAMSAHEKVRYLVLLAMTATFFAIVGISYVKFSERSIGETQSTKKAAEMHFPSLLLCPYFISNFSFPRTGTMNLTEYYLNRSPIKDHVLDIYQQYVTDDDGLVAFLAQHFTQ